MVPTRVRVVLGIVLLLGLAQSALRADERRDDSGQTPRFVDRFKGEPDRPRVSEPIAFMNSLEQAKATARSTDRRILIYFAGPGCGWCRALEARTFTDAEVVGLSKKFVCVQLDTDRDPRLADEFRIDTIPRSMLLLADGTMVDQRVGYLPATEFATWLKAGLVRPARRDLQAARPPIPPPPVGFPESQADLILWFVDNDRVAEGWREPDAFRHPVFLQLLGAIGFKPRVEHLSRADFPARWQQAETLHRLPDFLAATNWAGMVRDLDKAGRFRTVLSERLTSLTGNASCQDFDHRFLWLVRGSGHESSARKAVETILGPGPELELSGPPMPEDCARDEAAEMARRAVVSYLSGDPEGLRSTASRRSSQLAECTRPGPWYKDKMVQAGSVELRGNDVLAVAVVEAKFESDQLLGADPVVVVLVREDGRWKVLVVSRNVSTVKDNVPRLCRLLSQAGPATSSPPEPRLLMPLDGQVVNESRPDMRWDIPSADGSLVGQVCEERIGPGDEENTSWPDVQLRVFPAEPRSGKVNVFSGVVGKGMSWCVWTIGRDGRIAVSPSAHFTVVYPNVKSK